MSFLGSVLSTRIGDIKGSCPENKCELLRVAVRNDYGSDVDVDAGICDHTGSNHAQDPKTGRVYLHHHQYVKEVSEVVV